MEWDRASSAYSVLIGLMETLLRGGEEGNRILILGWLLLKSRKMQKFSKSMHDLKPQQPGSSCYKNPQTACTSCQEHIWCIKLNFIPQDYELRLQDCLHSMEVNPG